MAQYDEQTREVLNNLSEKEKAMIRRFDKAVRSRFTGFGENGCNELLQPRAYPKPEGYVFGYRHPHAESLWEGYKLAHQQIRDEGKVVLPREPTEAMLVAAHPYAPKANELSKSLTNQVRVMTSENYRAMIAASQTDEGVE